MTPEFATLSEAARLTGVRAATIKAAYEAGRIAALIDGARMKYRIADIRALAQVSACKPRQSMTRRERSAAFRKRIRAEYTATTT